MALRETSPVPGAVVLPEAHAIDQRHAVYEKFSDCVDDLALVAKAGDMRYGEEPQNAVDRLQDHDDGFHTDIQAELERIELNLTRQRLEAQWAREEAPAMPDASPDELDEAREQWVQARLGKKSAKVSCALPTTRILPGTAQKYPMIPSRIREQGMTTNEQFEMKVNDRQQKGVQPDQIARVGDYVAFHHSEDTGEIVTMRGDDVEIAVHGTEDGETRTWCKKDEIYVTFKGHPAKAVTSLGAKRSRKPYSGPLRSHAAAGDGRSQLALLFSKKNQGQTPTFLNPSDDKLRIKEAEAAEKGARPKATAAQRSRTQGDTSLPGRHRGTAGAAPRFMEVHTAAGDGPQVRVLEKQVGQPFGMKWDPETMRILDAVRDSGVRCPGFDSTLSDLRGMRITHIWFDEQYQPSPSDAVHTPTDVRRALSRATQSNVVCIKFDKWTRKWAVEKRRSEQAEKSVVNKAAARR